MIPMKALKLTPAVILSRAKDPGGLRNPRLVLGSFAWLKITMAWVGVIAGVLLSAAVLSAAPKGAFTFDSYVGKPADWFATPEAQALADKLLLFQDPSGGWPKNRIMTLTPA